MQNLKTNSPLRAILAIILVVIWVLISQWPITKYILHFAPAEMDLVGLFEIRIEPIKSISPGNLLYGYTNDSGTVAPWADYEAARQFVLVQYALAPAIIVADTSQDYVIGNFRDPGHEPRFDPDRPIELRRDFGNGLHIYWKGSK